MSLFPSKPTIVGERVTLRPFTADDLPAMAEALADPDVNRLTGSVHSTAAAESAPKELDERTTDWYLTRADQPDRLDLAIVANDTGECVGEVVLNEWDEANALCNFRILIGPTGRDRGLGSEATRLVLHHAFTTTDLQRIELGVFDFNPRAQRAYEKAGFVAEGRKRKAFVFDGERYDEIVMGALRDEWLLWHGE